jgi:hypothetical protein
VLTTDDGLPTNACTWAAALDRRGLLWVGTMGGLAVTDPALLVLDRRKKPLLLESFEVNGERRVPEPGAALDHRERRISVSFALLAPVGEKALRYRTQLFPLDAEPQRWTTDPVREYLSLPAGRYNLRIWGRDRSGNETGPLELPFSIAPAPWRTWWAYLGYALFLGGLVTLGVRLRVRTLSSLNEELERKVDERTSELAKARPGSRPPRPRASSSPT